MDKKDATFYLMLGEFAVGQANAHSEVLKMFLQRVETLENVLVTTSKIYQMPEGVEKRQVLADLCSAVERLSNLTPLAVEIKDSFAQAESYREKLEAFLRDLKEDDGQP